MKGFILWLNFYTEHGLWCLNIMHDWAGCLFLLFSFSIVLMWKSIRDDTKVVHAIWFCIVLHHAVVYLNVYFPDASSFHGDGKALAASVIPEPGARFSNGAVVYTHFLGYCYRAFGASFLFGKELSVFAFVLSCVVLVKLVDL